jgi:hypothetical protein
VSSREDLTVLREFIEAGMYRSGLVPRRMALFALIGGPLLAASGIAILFGLFASGSALLGIATIPEFIWEAFLGLWLTFKGSIRLPSPQWTWVALLFRGLLLETVRSPAGEQQTSGRGARGHTRQVPSAIRLVIDSGPAPAEPAEMRRRGGVSFFQGSSNSQSCRGAP